MTRTLLCGIVLVIVAGFVSAWADRDARAADGAKAAQPLSFNKDIRPILAENCYACHGPDAHTLRGGFRVSDRESATGKAESGKTPIVPGKSAGSELIARINHPDAKQRMPHHESGKALTDAQKKLLARWIDEGAEYQQHWSLNTPVKAEPPAVKDKRWVRNAIDAFILARLEAEGLKPQPEADKRTLIRRVTLDLTGLPPTAAEVEAFVTDTSPDAYDRVVDRLLASPRYGEHMARFWLDAARYGDTHGLHLDNYREMYPYRDWVIGAFNSNMPFDQFTIRQLAGDMLPDATLDDQVASGFNRCHVSTNEGGSIAEEVFVRNVNDRVVTTGTVFLGLTMECTRCHDHKFDPLTMKDFYAMYAIFNSIEGNPLDGNAAAWAPVVRAPSGPQRAKLDVIDAAIAALQAEAKRQLATTQYVEPQLPAYERKELVWIDDAIPAGVEASANDGKQNLTWTFAEKAGSPVLSGERSLKLKATGLQQFYFHKAASGLRVGAGDTLFAYVYIDPADPPKQIMLQWHTSGWRHRAYWGQNVIPWGADNTGERRRIGDLPKAGEWVRLEVPVDAVGLSAADTVVGWAFTQHDGTAYWDKAGIATAVAQDPVDFVWIDDEAPGPSLAGDGANWQWVLADGGKHPVHTGQRSLRRSGGDGLNQDYFTGAAALTLHAGDKLFAHVYLDPSNPPKSVQLQFNDGGWEHRVRWGAPAHGAGRGNGADFVASDKPPETGKWVRLEVDIGSVGLKPGSSINGWAFTQVGGTVYWDTAGVRTLQPPDDRHLQSLAIWADRARTDASLTEALRQAAVGAPGGRTPEQQAMLRDHYVQWVWAGSRNAFDPINAQITQRRTEREAMEKAFPTTLVSKEQNNPRPAFVLKRGEYTLPDKDLGPIPRRTPESLPPMPEDAPANRLGFARWLVSAEQPLTARVTVNRFWLQCFGIGIVETAEDFGTQGAFPTHPELLDYLAVDFRETGWDVKRLMKLMVSSATYRQSGACGPELRERDPKNQLYARGPRGRLDAEVLRDQALFVGGILVEEIGGPGVKPPQPAGLWEAVGYVSSNTRNFKADTGPGKVHRRSLYTFWKRTAPPPQMTTFDSPSRESCSVRRERTNTPLQALLLMNDPQYVEAARSFAQRAILDGGGTPDARIDYMVGTALGRPALPEEASILAANLADHIAHFKADAEAAKKLIAIGDPQNTADPKIDPVELAAYTMLANLLLNLDEFVCKN